jgi:transcriptional regulator with XRE-family HTH domain
MTRIEKLKAESKRAAKAALWQTKLDNLYERKGIKESEFCRKHGIEPTRFNRNKTGETIPSEETLKKVQAAFRAERV